MRIAALALLVTTCVSCMEMRETVERMVMVRTTGSDLQPAATGFIYKKENDGEASVIKMGKSEVEKHLSKLHEQPQAYTAPIPIVSSPFYTKEGDDKPLASEATEHIIPVVEVLDSGKHADGIADEEYEKIIKEYASKIQNYNGNVKDYLYSRLRNKENNDNEKDNSGSNEDQGKSNNQDFQTEKYESYSISSKGDYGKKNAASDDLGKKTASDEDKAIDEYHKLFDNDEYKKGVGFYDEGAHEEGGYGKFSDGYRYQGPDAGSDELYGHDELYTGVKKQEYYGRGSGDSHRISDPFNHDHDSYRHYHGDVSPHGSGYLGKSFGYDVHH